MKPRLMKDIVKYGLFILPVLMECVTAENIKALHAVTAASDKFAMDLYMKLIGGDGNLIVSPLGVQIVLAMVTSGAKGKTWEELVNVMGYPRDMKTLHLGYQALLDLLQRPELKMANSIFVEETTEILPQFHKNMVTYFTSEVENLPFLSNPSFSANKINKWAEKKTNGKIKNLFTPADLKQAGIVLANAIHFKAKWAFQFDEDKTTNDNFFITKTTKSTVKMMHIRRDFQYGYVPKLKSKILEMPYKNRRFSMVIILPDDIEGLPEMEKELHKVGISEVTNDDNTSYEKVIVKLPRFKIESDLELKEPLNELGIHSMFGTHSSDLRGMLQYKDSSEPVNITVSKVKQKSFVEVKEDGTEAAAVTAAVGTMVTSSWGGYSPPPKEFIADHPFIFLITARGASSRHTLFLGRVTSIKDV